MAPRPGRSCEAHTREPGEQTFAIGQGCGRGRFLGWAATRKTLRSLVGTAGFEPATTCTPSKCATRLRYVPTGRAKASLAPAGVARRGGTAAAGRKTPNFRNQSSPANSLGEW